MTTYMVAQSTPPVVWCPEWCERAEMHIDELSDWDGRVVHIGFWNGVHTTLTVGRTLLPSGDIDHDTTLGSRSFGLTIAGRDFTLDEAEEFAAELADAIAAARAEEARTR